MRNKFWTNEPFYGLIFFILAIVCSLVTGLWAISFLLWSFIYILWKWLEMLYFYHWYINGADKHNVPLNHGAWKDLSSVVLHNKDKNKKIEKKNSYLLNQFNTMSQALPYATVLLNKRFEIIWANQSAGALLNIYLENDKDNRVDNIIREPDFQQLLNDDLQESELKMPHPNDIHKYTHLKIVKLSNKRYLLVARDISQQESLRKSRKAFVDNASHELRTPLTVISGYLEMLTNSGDVPQKWYAAIEQALQQTQRMEKIINDMLKLSSIEHEHYLEDNSDTIDMPLLLNRLFNDVKNSSKAKTHQFTANIDSSLKISGNEDEITSVILNLLNNAVIHTKADTNISMRWFKQNQRAHLWISDTGKGIKSKHLTHLTERFYRVDNSRDQNTNSTGLGLAIAKQICDNHNATLSIESEVNKGTNFKVEFPVSRIVNL